MADADHHEDSFTLDSLRSFDTGVDLGGLMALLSQHLYSTPEVAVRELVQNAHDAIARRRRIDPNPSQPEIFVDTDDQAKTLVVRDTGCGLTESEIHELLATIGIGATRQLREADEVNGDLIGQFGLGFLSVFVIADEVSFTTTSWKSPGETWEYRSFDGHNYTGVPATTREVGTTVTLRLAADQQAFADPNHIEHLLRRYCILLSEPIRLNGGPSINLDPPWRQAQPDEQTSLLFALAFERRFEPLAALPVSTGPTVSGSLWIQGGNTYDSSDNRKLSIFVRGMMLTENERDLLPRWAGFVSGVIESTELTPTASRESLQRDAGFDRAAAEIAEALIAGLEQLALAQPAVWSRLLTRHWQALVGGAIVDERLFELVAEHIQLPTSHGRLTIPALVENGEIHVTPSLTRGFEEVLFLARAIPVARGDSYGVIRLLRLYTERNGLRLVELGTSPGDSTLFTRVELPQADTDWLQTELGSYHEEVVPSHYEPATVPLVVVPDHEVEVKRRVESDAIQRAAGPSILSLATQYTAQIEEAARARVYLNLACPSVALLIERQRANPADVTQAVALLRTVKNLMAMATEARPADIDVAATFGDALQLIDRFLTPES